MSLESSINTVANISERLLRNSDLRRETQKHLNIAIEKGDAELVEELQKTLKALLNLADKDRRLMDKITDAATRKKP